MMVAGQATMPVAIRTGGKPLPKRILVFMDGTGNEGGLLPDESRTNVYKLFRATRSGPDSCIDPTTQVAFYIHGIGTPEPGKSMKWRDHVHQMFGAGLTQRIIDGYAAVVSVWEPGDLIYLFGFSRGAYAARCLGHVLELFGRDWHGGWLPGTANIQRCHTCRRMSVIGG